MMSYYFIMGYIWDFPFHPISHEEITHALLQYDSCEFGLSDRSYCNNSILFDPTSDDDVKWLLQQGECRLASLSFRQYEYTRRVISIASGHRITSRLKQFPPEDSRVSPIEHLLQAQLCYAAFVGDHDRMQSLQPCCGDRYCEYVHYAAAGGQVGIICKLLQEGCPVDNTNSCGHSLLHIAALYDRNEVAVELIERGANLESLCGDGCTALHYAAQNGYVEIIKNLLKGGCPIDINDNSGLTALFYAAANGHTEAIVELITNGAAKDISVEGIGTSLHLAAKSGHLETVIALLNEGCNVLSIDDFGRTAIHLAAGKGHMGIIRELLRRDCPIDLNDAIGSTPLFYAVANGHTEVVVELIANGAGKDICVQGIGTPLHLAASVGHFGTVKALLNEGFNVHAVNDSGRSAIHQAGQGGHVDIIRELLRRDSPINAKDKCGITPLHHAAACGKTGAVVELIANGAAKDVSVEGIGTPLHLAAESGHFETVKALLEEGCNVLAVDDCGRFALHAAGQGGHVDIIMELLKRDCPIDAKDIDGNTPLHFAAACGQTEAVVELIKNGANKDLVAGICGTSLHLAAFAGHLEIAKVLLDEGCSVLAVIDNGRTVLHLAALSGHVDIVRELLRRSCPINIKDKSGLTALYYAAANGHTQVVVELIANGAEKYLQQHGTPLHQAAANGHLETVEALLDDVSGCSVRSVDGHGRTALHLAASMGHVEIVRKLLRQNCFIDIKDKSGCTALHEAAAYDRTETVVELIKNGADKDVVAWKYGTPLHQAAIGGYLETIKALLDSGCSVFAVTDNSKTALHFAALKGHVDIVREILRQSCPIDIRDKSARTALHDAAACGQTEAVVELIKNGAEIDAVAGEYGTPLHQAANGGYFETVEALLDEGCSVLAVIDNGWTVLHLAALNGHMNIVRELLRRNCPINIKDKSGFTALYYAAANGHTEVVVELIANGAEKYLQQHGTPLHQAAANGHLETVEALLDDVSGCSVRSVDGHGRTALHLAALKGHVEIVRKLLRRNCPINLGDRQGYTALYYAAGSGQTEVAVELMENGGRMSFITRRYLGTPLHLAAKNGHLDVTRELLRRNCPVNLGDRYGFTPLYRAAEKGQTEVVEELIKNGAKIHMQITNPRLGTPLHLAAKNGHLETVKLLLHKGCLLNAKDAYGQTAIFYAAKQAHLGVVQTKVALELFLFGAFTYFVNVEKLRDLIIRGGHCDMLEAILTCEKPTVLQHRDHVINVGLCKAIAWDQEELALKLIDKGTSRHFDKLYDGRTPLHYAAFHSKTEVAVRLISKGATKDIVAGTLGTALHLAALSGCSEIFKALVENGCSLKCVDVRGYTVLHFAVLSGRMNWELLKEILIQHRWLINKPDREEEWTPLHVAARHGKTAVAVELIRWGAEKDPMSRNGHNPLFLAGVHGHVKTFIQLLEEGCSMHSLGYNFLVSLEKQPGVTKNTILTALLERGYDLDVSQVSLFTWPFAVAKRRSLEEFQTAFNIQEKHTWIQQYHKALDNHGYVHVNVIRCVLVGPPKVGKSCLKHLLVHNQSKEIENSTPVMESPDVVTFNREMYLASAQSTTSAWEYVSDEGMGAILRGWTENVAYHSAESYPRSTVAVAKDTLLASHQPLQSNQKESMVYFHDEEVNVNLVNEITPDVEKPNHTHTKSNIVKLKIAHCHLVSQVKEYKNTGGDEKSVQYTTFINLIDSGGQPTFMDTLPLLLGTPCTYLHVFNASKDVDYLAEITYRDRDGIENIVASTETTWELMLRSFSSVHTLEYKCSEHLKDVMEDGISVPPCRIAVVGTFKDELLKSPNHEEVVAELNLRLKVFNEHAHSSQPLMRDKENDRYLFLVDNLMYKNCEHETVEDYQYLNSFRNALSSEGAALKLKIPLMWLMMELVTRKSGVKYIPYRDLKTFSLDHGYIDDNEHADDQFRALLMLFHNLGFYAYYELEGVERENNLVCTEATVLFKEISKLLLIHFITPQSPAAKHFQEKGEILLKEEGYKDLFSEIGVDSNIDSEWFLKVIQHLGLSAKLSYSLLGLGGESSVISSYFIPLALPCKKSNLPMKSTVAKLHFTLKCWEGFSHTYRLPRVIFPRLIVILANDWNNWQPQLPNSDRTTVKFLHKGSFVYISERATLIEVNLLVPKEAFADRGSTFKPTEADVKELHILCDNIQDNLTRAITKACTATFGDSFTKSASVVCGSLCSLCGAEVPHVATPSGGPGKLLMCPRKNQPFPMTSEQQIWFSDIDHSTVQVSLIEGTGIDSFEPFWFLGPSNSAPTGKGSPVTRQQIDPHKFDLDSKPCESDLLQLVGDCYNPKWKEFGIRLGISGNTCEGISQQKSGDPEAWLTLLCKKWLSYEAGTGDKHRTWRTVFGTLRMCGFPGVAVDKVPADQILKPTDIDIHSKPSESELLELVGDHIDSKWQNFGIELGICKNVCEGIKIQKLCIPKECFILLCSKWLSSEAGTGDKPRTWRTVLEAVRECDFPEVADQVEQSFSKNPVLSRKPDLKDLANLIGGEFGPKWSQLGRPLSIDESIIAAIQTSSDVDCFVDMMRMWLDRREGSGTRPRTWDTVLSGLVEIGNGNLAGQVERHLVAKSSQC